MMKIIRRLRSLFCRTIVINVTINAMDAKSLADRSDDIARALRQQLVR